MQINNLQRVEQAIDIITESILIEDPNLPWFYWRNPKSFILILQQSTKQKHVELCSESGSPLYSEEHIVAAFSSSKFDEAKRLYKWTLGLGIKRNTTYNYCAAYGLYTNNKACCLLSRVNGSCKNRHNWVFFPSVFLWWWEESTHVKECYMGCHLIK